MMCVYTPVVIGQRL